MASEVPSVKWQVQLEGRKWGDYPGNVSSALEKIHNDGGPHNSLVYKAENNETYEVGLLALTQQNVGWGTTRKVRRFEVPIVVPFNRLPLKRKLSVNPEVALSQPTKKRKSSLWDALVKMNLKIFYEKFKKQGYRPDHFETLTDENLGEIGVKKGFLKRFRAIFPGPLGTVAPFEAPVHDSVEKNETKVVYKSSKPLTSKQLEMKEVLERMHMSQFLEVLFVHGFDDVTFCHHLTKKVQTEIGFGPGHKLKWIKEFHALQPVVKQPKPQPDAQPEQPPPPPTVPSAPVPTQPETQPQQQPEVVLPAVLPPLPKAGVYAEFADFKNMLNFGIPPIASKLPESKVDAFLKAMVDGYVVPQKKKTYKVTPSTSSKKKTNSKQKESSCPTTLHQKCLQE